jgi:hypothetical protein
MKAAGLMEISYSRRLNWLQFHLITLLYFPTLFSSWHPSIFASSVYSSEIGTILHRIPYLVFNSIYAVFLWRILLWRCSSLIWSARPQRRGSGEPTLCIFITWILLSSADVAFMPTFICTLAELSFIILQDSRDQSWVVWGLINYHFFPFLAS